MSGKTIEYKGVKIFVKDTDSEKKIEGRKRRIDREQARNEKRGKKKDALLEKQNEQIEAEQEEKFGDYA